MADDCCGQQRAHTEGLLGRSLYCLILGCLLLLPPVEAFVTTGVVGYICLLGLTTLLTYSIAKDFAHQRNYCFTMLIAVSLALSAPIVAGTLLAPVFLTVAVSLGAVALFVNDAVWQHRYQALHPGSEQKTARLTQPNSVLRLPSVEQIILLFVILNWSISFASLVASSQLIYSFVLHDALLTLGTFNLASWIKQRMQSTALPHNHASTTVSISDPDESKSKTIPITELKQGMVIEIKQGLMLPVACQVVDTCHIRDDVSEGMLKKSSDEIINVNTYYYSGSVKCLANYQPTNHASQRQQTETPDRLLQAFLILVLSIAVIAGLWQGFTAGSIVAGFQSFCMNLMVSCPCVFLVAKPIIHAKLLDWVNKEKSFQFNQMPSRGAPTIMVFDRTHTLYQPNSEDLSGPYILSNGVKALLQELKAKGITVYILSGHGTGDWQAHLQACKTELNGLVDGENIIFDVEYHDPKHGAKRKVITNLQRYGSVTKPVLGSSAWFMSHFKRLFGGHVVGMVGDGNNDVEAMQQADVGICVAADLNNLNDQAAKQANFFVAQDKLSALAGLMQMLGQAQQTYRYCMGSALGYNLLLLALINGLFFALSGLTFPPAAACFAVSGFCIAVLGAVSLTTFSQPSTLQQMMTTPQVTVCDQLSHDDQRSKLPILPSCNCRSCRPLFLPPATTESSGFAAASSSTNARTDRLSSSTLCESSSTLCES